jgi:predicted PurR-regulated permease PerM
MRPTGQSQPNYSPLGSEPSPISRRLSRSISRLAVPLLTFLLGMVLGVMGLLLYASSIATEGNIVVTPLPPPGNDIIAQVSTTYISRVGQNDLSTSGLPGNIQNVRVHFNDSDVAQNVQVTITADDQVGVAIFQMTTHVTIVVQLFIQDCKLKANVLHADLDGIPATRLLKAFEGQINEQLQFKTNNLPPGFTYCITGVRSKPDSLFATIEATPM